MSNANTLSSPARPGSAYWGGIILFSVFTLLVIVWFKSLGTQETYDKKRGDVRVTKLQALRAEDAKTLTEYAWGNKEKGVAHIPIDRAMELVASELKASTVSPSAVKVENPYPAGLAPAPAPAPEATK